MLDLGAPFTVLSYSVWSDKGLFWQGLGSQCIRADAAKPAALTCRGVHCQMAETQVWVVNAATAMRSRLMRVRAKPPSHKAAPTVT